MSPDEAMLNSEEIKAIAIIELHLSEGISKGGRECVSQSVENSNSIANFWNGL